MKRLLLIASLLLAMVAHARTSVDVLVVGGSTSGTTAAVQAARMGASTLLVEEGPWLGGMLTAAGVSAVDGNYRLRAGMWGEFLDSLAVRYGGLDQLKTGWVSNVLFEPHVGNEIFHNMTTRAGVQVWHGVTLTSLLRKNDKWLATIGGKEVEASIVIDATELGDVAAMLGLPRDVGMESRAVTGEDIAPMEANGIVQDLTYVAILEDYGHDVTIERPEGYDPQEFAHSCDNPLCINPKDPSRVWSPEMMMSYGRLPGNKWMINWPIDGNDYYANMVNMTPSQREQAVKEAKARTMRFLYFMQHELGYNTLGIARDEFPSADGLPLIPYHRESGRIHGLTRFTLQHAMAPYDQPLPLYRTGIAVGDYPVDHHHTRYTGQEQLPDLHFHPVPSFSVPLGCIIPQGTQGFIVAEKSIGVSNIMNGATRLQPVVMQLGTAAGITAALAVKNGCDVKDVGVRDVQRTILDAGGYLMPYLDMPPTSPMFKHLQRIGATGILRGTGKNVDWSNETWIYPDSALRGSDITGLIDYYPETQTIIEQLGDKVITRHDINALLGITTQDDDVIITRGEFALLVDSVLKPFDQPVDHNGNIIKGKPAIMWIDAEANLARFASRDSIDYYLRKIKSLGFTHVVVDVRPITGEVMWDSDIAPRMRVWRGSKGPDFDYLAYWLERGQQLGLEVHASLNVFCAGHNYYDRGLIYSGHPEWASTVLDPERGLIPITQQKKKYGAMVNPLNEEYRQHITSVLKELVQRYPTLDGVVLDRVRYDGIEADFSTLSRSAFEQFLGHEVKNWPGDILKWKKKGGKWTPKTGKLARQWWEFRARTITEFMAQLRSEVKTVNPNISFGTYTGAWYPSYYEVGVNFASNTYDPSHDFDWATAAYKETGYAEMLDLYITGNYYTDITIAEAQANRHSIWNETDSQAHTGLWYCVEGSCQHLRGILGGNKFMGGILVDQFYDNPAKLSATIAQNLKDADGLMVFDIVHIITHNLWQQVEDGMRQGGNLR